MSGRRRRIASLFVAGLLVSLAIGSGIGPAAPVGTAEAQSVVDCSWYDSTLWGYTMMMTRTAVGADTGCRLVQSDPDDAAMADVYAGARTIHESQTTALAVVDNRLTDARSPAMTEAKIAMVHAHSAGKNETEATRAAHAAIEEYYSPIVANLNALWGQKVGYWNYSAHAEIQSSGSFGAWVGGESMPLTVTDGTYHPTLVNRSLTLPNGSEVPTVAIHGTLDGSAYDLHYSGDAYLSGDNATAHPDAVGNEVVYSHLTEQTYHVLLEVPSQTQEDWAYDRLSDIVPTTGVSEPSDTLHYYHDSVYAEIEQLQANVDPLVNATYQQYDPDEIDTTDVLSPTELASRAATEYNSTGYYAFLASQFAMMGYAGNLPTSHVVEYNGTTYNGSVFYTGDDLSGLETGRLYDPADYAGAFVMAYQDGTESATLDLEGPFTIVEMIDTRTGETVSNATMAEYTYETTNATELLAELERLVDAREEIVAEDTPASGGGLFDGLDSFLDSLLSGTPTRLLLLAGAVVGIVLLGEG
ncbi:hypothetical protein [Halanaeroarchaeum sulfurireducens]|uniref:Envelope protein N-terminal domain-containing protein n=1 Tax=Halanaeroarchaeum sulfurireducens TaxID=1604004 RepID=A0A0F7PDB8_9EURY|nr:hypothetical protein [Halanaeroarchaeum sulfurireducens]AKH97353.1 hypothetical protein HLASF_0860 [Halanaeroarchaeum sulfurireducens]ALG81755.1 hypothetical protein HLASA_0857 [Halanaeroarchaeum sulfurireducens]